MRNPYDVLGVSPTDSKVEIKAKYRKLIKTCHPDLLIGAGKSPEEIKEAEKRFKAIQEAWEYLDKHISESKPKQRWTHDSLFKVSLRSF